MKRTSTAVWQGSGKEGGGHLTTQSQVLNKTAYTWSSRFAEGTGTNPEELLAAAHAGCFTMKLSFILGEAGFVPTQLETTSEVTIESGTITESHLSVKATVPGLTAEKLNECAENAKINCPVSKALATQITLEASLVEKAVA